MQVDEDRIYRILGERLRHRRLEINMTQTQLAEEAGLLRTTVTNIEAGRQRAPLQTLYKLSRVLRVDVAELLPATSDVAEPPLMQIDHVGHIEQVPPRTRELVRRLREEGYGADSRR